MQGENSSSENNGVEVVPCTESTPAPVKKVFQSNYKALNSGVGLIFGAINETGPIQEFAKVKVKKEPSPAISKKLSIRKKPSFFALFYFPKGN